MLLIHTSKEWLVTETLCLQTFLLPVLPWLYTAPGKFIVVPINHSQPRNQQTSNSPAGSTDRPHNPYRGNKHFSKWNVSHLKNTCTQSISCAKRNCWLQQMIWRDQRNAYQGGNLLLHMILFPFPLLLRCNCVRQSPKQRISEASLFLFSQVFQKLCLFFSLYMD